MDEEIEDLGARIDGLRLVIAILVSSASNASDLTTKIHAAEVLARQRNLPTGLLTELVFLQETLEGLDD